jgi:signal transduction histidine kinase
MQPSSLEITATPTVVIRIVANIVFNAIKHSQASRILIGVRRRQHSAEIIIADDGKGMSQQELNRITQAYQKGPDSSGEGLGMAISKQLAEQNGMQLNIDSAEGRGSCFRLELDR